MEAKFTVVCLKCKKERLLVSSKFMNYDPTTEKFLEHKKNIMVDGGSSGGYGVLVIECPCGNRMRQDE